MLEDKDNKSSDGKAPEEVTVATQKAKIEELTTENEKLKEENTSLHEALASKEDQKSEVNPVFKSDKKEYELVIPKSKFNGKEVTAKTLKQDQKMVDELVKIGAGCLKLKGEDK
jgi:regulator of replication initiation timing